MTFLIGPEAAAAFFKATDKELGQDEVYGFMKPVFGEVRAFVFGGVVGWVLPVPNQPPLIFQPHPNPTQPKLQGVVYDSDPKKRTLQMQRTANALKSNRLRTYVEKITKARACGLVSCLALCCVLFLYGGWFAGGLMFGVVSCNCVRARTNRNDDPSPSHSQSPLPHIKTPTKTGGRGLLFRVGQRGGGGHLRRPLRPHHPHRLPLPPRRRRPPGACALVCVFGLACGAAARLCAHRAYMHESCPRRRSSVGSSLSHTHHPNNKQPDNPRLFSFSLSLSHTTTPHAVI